MPLDNESPCFRSPFPTRSEKHILSPTSFRDSPVRIKKLHSIFFLRWQKRGYLLLDRKMLPLVSKNHSRICSHHLDGPRLFSPMMERIKVVAKYHLFRELSEKAHSTCFAAFIEALGWSEGYPHDLNKQTGDKTSPLQIFQGTWLCSWDTVLRKCWVSKYSVCRGPGVFWNFEGKRTLSFHQARSTMAATHCPAFACICPQHREPPRLPYFTFWWTTCVSSRYGSMNKRASYQENSVSLM